MSLLSVAFVVAFVVASVASVAFLAHIVAHIVAHITSLYLLQVCIKKELKKSPVILVHKVKFPQNRVHPLVVFVTMGNTKTIRVNLVVTFVYRVVIKNNKCLKEMPIKFTNANLVLLANTKTFKVLLLV